MISRKFLFLIIVTLPIFLGFAKPAIASGSASDFPSCLNPQGKVIASYSNGDHGVIGRGSFSGADTVYRLSDQQVMQCLCASNGSGIQTNWRKITGLSDYDIEVEKRRGWYYVPYGSDWGLDNTTYLAKNIDYTCRESSTKGTVAGVLASTGNMEFIYTLIIFGGIALISSLIFKKLSK